jgi:hypothetical protein
MGKRMKGFIKQTKKMDLEYLNGQMERGMKVGGQMGSKKVTAFSLMVKRSSSENGLMVNEARS